MFNNNKIKIKNQVIVGDKEIKKDIWISDYFCLITDISFV